MQTLARAVAKAGVAGEPLPVVFPTLEAAGVRPRRGQLALIAGPPNAGKSIFAFLLTAGMNLPSLYISADTDDFTTALRGASAVSGLSQRVLEARAEREGRQVLADMVADDLENLQFSFDPSPSLEDIELEVLAFKEVWGEYPSVIVVDNLMNVLADDGDEWRGLRLVMSDLHDLARRTKAHVMALHHVSETYDPMVPAPRKALHGKISQLPELILTCANTGQHLLVAPVKNRTGPHRADGSLYVWLGMDPERMSLTDPLRSSA